MLLLAKWTVALVFNSEKYNPFFWQILLENQRLQGSTKERRRSSPGSNVMVSLVDRQASIVMAWVHVVNQSLI